MIKIYNRKTKAYDVEQVAGLKYINWSYASPIGKSFLELFIKKKMFSKLYGNFCDSPLSKKKIKAFIDEFNIDMSLCNKNIYEFDICSAHFLSSKKYLHLFMCHASDNAITIFNDDIFRISIFL